MEKITNWEIKRTNRNNIYREIYASAQTSKQQIAENLDLSLPTVTQNLKVLEDLGLIKKDGFFESSSSGGRKANIITCEEKARIAIGVEVFKEKSYIVATDLYGDILKDDIFEMPFRKDELYFCALGNWVNYFISELPYQSDVILGVGICIQGLISSDSLSVVYSPLMNCTDMSLKEFAQYIKWPCLFIHDSEATAFREVWRRYTSAEPANDALFLVINNNFGGSLIINGKTHHGAGHLGGTIEHMRIHPEGRPCYCGQKGCAETYCSGEGLQLTVKEPLAEFFSALRSGDAERNRLWKKYLRDLALTINNSIMVFDCDIIIGGTIRSYFLQEDVELIKVMLKDLFAFPFYEPRITLGTSNEYAGAIGAALSLVANFLDNGDVFQ